MCLNGEFVFHKEIILDQPRRKGLGSQSSITYGIQKWVPGRGLPGCRVSLQQICRFHMSLFLSKDTIRGLLPRTSCVVTQVGTGHLRHHTTNISSSQGMQDGQPLSLKCYQFPTAQWVVDQPGQDDGERKTD